MPSACHNAERRRINLEPITTLWRPSSPDTGCGGLLVASRPFSAPPGRSVCLGPVDSRDGDGCTCRSPSVSHDEVPGTSHHLRRQHRPADQMQVHGTGLHNHRLLMSFGAGGTAGPTEDDRWSVNGREAPSSSKMRTERCESAAGQGALSPWTFACPSNGGGSLPRSRPPAC